MQFSIVFNIELHIFLHLLLETSKIFVSFSDEIYSTNATELMIIKLIDGMQKRDIAFIIAELFNI